MGSVSVWLLSLILCWGFPSPHTTLSYAAVYYVTPHSPNPDCPSGEPCLTINEYAQGNYFDGDDNTTLLFLNGEHNLTAQNLGKISLKMAASHAQAEVQIYQAVSIIVQDVSEVEISGLKLTSHLSNLDTPLCLSIADTSQHLLVTMVTIESCELQLLGEMKAIITELTASNSLVRSLIGQYKHYVAIRNSSFNSSIFEVNSSVYQDFICRDTVNMSALNIESSSMFNSQLRMKLEMQTFYKLSILDTHITGHSDYSSNTGVAIEALGTSTLHAIIKNCDYIGNKQGINVSADGNSQVELSVEQCHITNNGKGHLFRGFGIGIAADGNSSVELDVDRSLIAYNGYNLASAMDNISFGGIYISRRYMFKKNTAVIIASIKSSRLVGNKYVQVAVEGSSRTTTVTCSTAQ